VLIRVVVGLMGMGEEMSSVCVIDMITVLSKFE
jgi:hypothetical protein